MKETPVTIVGAGPSGLVLGLSLAQYGIHSTILERDLEIGEDPRGVYLAGDAVRNLYQLGIGDQMEFIGQECSFVEFHESDFRNPAFFRIPSRDDWMQQAVPPGIFQIQPRLEAVLREAVSRSTYCTLQPGCNVMSREELHDGIVVHYQEEGIEKQIKTTWLVGADGKTGVVRKKFLEPTANVQQATGLYEYTGAWVAANLKITLPTPESHPNLDLWKLGLSSEEVYDLFWPENWHFCAPPGKATACGRFGPRETRYWRHEFAEPEWNDSKDAVQLLWEHLTPMITRSADKAGRPFKAGDMTFPRDCVEILRCRPFTFTQKVVNKWFHGRTILIGDAAHVFPPFGGQGIACGIRDADALAWRLAILVNLDLRAASKDTDCKATGVQSIQNKMLESWSAERRQGVDDSTRLTMANGQLCNKPRTWAFTVAQQILHLLSFMPGAPTLHSQALASERNGYKPTKAGCFLSDYRGGGKLAQVYVKSRTGKLILSDTLLRRGKGVLTILVLDSGRTAAEGVGQSLRSMNMPKSILSEESVVFVSPCCHHEDAQVESYRLCTKNEFDGVEIRNGYNSISYLSRFPRGTKYAIVRPDLIIFAACKTIPELEYCMLALKKKLGA